MQGTGNNNNNWGVILNENALQLLERGVIDVLPFVSHRYHALADVERAFGQEFLQPDYVKGVIQLA